MNRTEALTELRGLIMTRDYLLHKVRRSRARDSEKAMTAAKYEREKKALRFAIDLIEKNGRGE